MGDFGYTAMTCEPYIERNVVETGDSLVIASDGIWDVIDDPIISLYTDDTSCKKSCAEIVRKICNDAVKRGSEDNISCIVIKFA